jgi:hypothetical protein
MAKPGRPKGGTSKLARSRIVTVRLDPVTRFAAELAAAKDRRTVSSFLEVACREAASTRQVAQDKDGGALSALQVAERMWHPDAEVQLITLAWHAPHLLSTDQQLLGDAVRHFITELNLLVEQAGIAKLREAVAKLTPAEHEGFHTPMFPVHLAKSALPTIKAAVKEKSVDYGLVAEIAKSELASFLSPSGWAGEGKTRKGKGQ